MTRRGALWLPATVLLVLSVACGSGDDVETTVEGGQQLACTGGTTDGPPALRLDLESGLEVSQGPVIWEVALTNESDDEVTIEFPSNQFGDVVVRAGDDEVYRWSMGLVFAQSIVSQPVAAGETFVFELGATELTVAPGRYELEASLTGSPSPEPLVCELIVG